MASLRHKINQFSNDFEVLELNFDNNMSLMGSVLKMISFGTPVIGSRELFSLPVMPRD